MTDDKLNTESEEWSSQLIERSLKNQGFNGIQTRDLRDTGAVLYQLSYGAKHWERGQFIGFISPAWGEMIWSIYETRHSKSVNSGFVTQHQIRRTLGVLVRVLNHSPLR